MHLVQKRRALGEKTSLADFAFLYCITLGELDLTLENVTEMGRNGWLRCTTGQTVHLKDFRINIHRFAGCHGDGC